MASARLPGKPLLPINGRPMILWVYDRARQSGADQVIVATDDERIESVCSEQGVAVEMTSSEHASGTDRIAEVARRRGWADSQIVVNVQGDEPLLPPVVIDQVAQLLDGRAEASMATLMTPVTSEREFTDPHMVKVVSDRNGYALYFSRAPIPADRDGRSLHDARRHIGLYAYRVGGLKRLADTPVCELERAEHLEQLRALWIGQRIAIADAVELPPRGVDTEQDLEAIRELAAEMERDD
jgi:3-deoxy-manno-octulosonate cytidylyltransferase (CMP-KDO synthetase)